MGSGGPMQREILAADTLREQHHILVFRAEDRPVELEGAEIKCRGQGCCRTVGGYGYIGDIKMTINWRDAGILDAIALTAEAGPEDLLLAGLDLAPVSAANYAQMGGGSESQ